MAFVSLLSKQVHSRSGELAKLGEYTCFSYGKSTETSSRPDWLFGDVISKSHKVELIMTITGECHRMRLTACAVLDTAAPK